VSPMAETPDRELTVLIASFLERDQVARIEAVAPQRVRAVWEPDLLPSPRYPADHTGIPPDLDANQLDRWRRHLAAADVLFDFDWLEPERLPENAPRVRWVQATSSGIGEFVARTGLDRWPAILTTAAGVHGVPLAEFVALGLLYLTKDVPELRRRQAAHHWERYTWRLLAGQRVLLIGLGHVGQRIAATCSGLGVEVWGMRREQREERPAGVTRIIAREELHEALGAVDALVLACPSTPETHHLIGQAELARLRPGAVIVNVGRGPVIDEPALIAALQDGHLGGAALDVFEEEPLPATNPLWDLPNVLVSPHSSSTVETENSLIVDLFIDNLRRYLDGRPLRNLYDRARSY
jgi:phosphoglycerate dehydrogenase-like enzyme